MSVHEPVRRIRRTTCLVVVALAAAGALHLWWTLARGAPAVFNADEICYGLMARSMAERQALDVGNGYDELASKELILPFTRPHQGRLFAQYPSTYAMVAAPFYAALGLRGLFLLNALAFIGCLGLCWIIGARLLGRPTAAVGTMLFGAATFAWEYSQAITPHMLGLFACLLTFYLALRALADAGPAAGRWALGSGLIGGLAVGIRIDCALMVAGVAAILGASRPARGRILLGFAAGLVPGLALLSATNAIKFGTWNPLSYGSSSRFLRVESYLPVLGALAAAALLAVVCRAGLLRPLAGRRRWLVALALAAATAALWAPIAAAAAGLYHVIVDLRGSQARGWSFERGPAGVLFSLGGVKKSLLQSCPYLGLVLVAVVHMVRVPHMRYPLLVLAGPPAVYLTVFGYLEWVGGSVLNMRYLLPALPFLALLAARGLLEVAARWRARQWAIFAAVALSTLAIFVGAAPLAMSRERQALAMAVIPLWAGAIFAGGLAIWLAVERVRPHARGLLAGAAAGLIAWACAAEFAYDARWTAAIRVRNRTQVADLEGRVRADAIVFTNYPLELAGLIDEGARVGVPYRDRWRSFADLVNAHASRGRAVYGAFTELVWRDAVSLIPGFAIRPLRADRNLVFAEIVAEN